MLPAKTTLVFNQKPEEKLQYIENLQKQGKNVMMIGDGLNDAGALAQSNVGISISENVNVFSPACDGILDATQFSKIAYFLKFSKNAMKTIYMSFGLSLLYNVVGLSFAVTGNLSPLVAAIINAVKSGNHSEFRDHYEQLFCHQKVNAYISNIRKMLLSPFVKGENKII